MAMLHYFGRLMDVMGTGREAIALPALVSDTAALRRWLDETRSLGGVLLEPGIRIAVNDELVREPAPVCDRDDIAFLPPVGGG